MGWRMTIFYLRVQLGLLVSEATSASSPSTWLGMTVWRCRTACLSPSFVPTSLACLLQPGCVTRAFPALVKRVLPLAQSFLAKACIELVFLHLPLPYWTPARLQHCVQRS